MSFYIANEQLDAQISKIKQKIQLSMNGVTADSMVEKGVIYRKNFGVELTVLREMAKSFSPSTDLAERLWLIGWRETLILSVFLQPLDSFTPKQAFERISAAPQKEIIDILCLYLLIKAEFATSLCLDLLNTDNENCRIAGFMLASRVYNKLNEKQIGQIIEKSETLSDTDNFQRYTSIGICLGRLCRTSTDNATKISDIVENFRISKIASQHAIANEVKQELDFLINL